jgi:hypothetical protein
MVAFGKDMIPEGNPIVDDNVGLWTIDREALMPLTQQGDQPLDPCAFGDIQGLLIRPSQDPKQA